MLASIHIQSLRCFHEVQFDFHHRLNFISGPNGSGKTALLEAIALLSTGYSFRSREISPLVQENQSLMTVFGRLDDTQTISIQKGLETHTRIQLNGQPCLRTSELAQFLPSQVIYQDIFQIIEAGPEVRRNVIDWGMFHVKHSYHELLKQYRQAVKQRNTLLKQHAPAAAFYPWNETLDTLSEKIDTARIDYITALTPYFQSTLSTLTPMTCALVYDKGWDKEKKGLTLKEVLVESYPADLKKQYTQYGAHHADLQLITKTGKAKTYLSRGQQKMLLLAFKIAQAQLLNKPCLYLWDDIGAELDNAHLTKLSEVIQSIPGQFFISGVNLMDSPLYQLNQRENCCRLIQTTTSISEKCFT